MLTMLYIDGTSSPSKQTRPESTFKKAICYTAQLFDRYATEFKNKTSTLKYISKYPMPNDYESLDLSRFPAIFQNEDIIVLNDRYGRFWQMIWFTCDANDTSKRPVIVEICLSINKNNTVNIMVRQTMPTFDIKKYNNENSADIDSLYNIINGVSITQYIEALIYDEIIGIDTGNGINYMKKIDNNVLPPKCLKSFQKRDRLSFSNQTHMPLLIVEGNEAILKTFWASSPIIYGYVVVVPCLIDSPINSLRIILYLAGRKHIYTLDKLGLDFVALIRKIVCMCAIDADRRYSNANPFMRPMLSPTVESAFSGKLTARSEQKIGKMTEKLQTTEAALEAANKKLKDANAALSTRTVSNSVSSQYEKELRDLNNTIKTLETDLRAKNAIIAQQQEDYTALKKQSKEHERQQQALIEHLKNKLSRPNKFSKITDWTRENFAGRLELTTKAERMLNVSDLSIDIDILCDAIEYLSTEYLDYMKNEITQNEMTSLMGLKYNRPFTVVPVMDSIITSAPEAYTTSYMTANNTLETRELNLHLRYGVNPENLIRIYFFYDEKERKIVVGSLPKHL